MRRHEHKILLEGFPPGTPLQSQPPKPIRFDLASDRLQHLAINTQVLIAAAHHTHHGKRFDRLLQDDSAVMDDELELVTPRHMILRFFSSPTRNKQGETVGRSFMFRDITEFRQARHEMIGTEKLISVLKRLSLFDAAFNFFKGVIHTRDIVFFVLVACFFLFLTLTSLGSRAWKGMK